MELSEERKAAIYVMNEEQKEANLKAFDATFRKHLKTEADTEYLARTLNKIGTWMIDQRFEHNESFLHDIEMIEDILIKSNCGTDRYIKTFQQMAKTSMTALIISNQTAEGLYLIGDMEDELTKIYAL